MAPLALLAAALSTLEAGAFMAAAPGRSRVTVAAADMSCDCAVIGAGPAGSVIAWLLAERGGLEVALVDPNLDKPWPNNYGVWESEFDALHAMMPELKLKDCVDHTWPVTDCFFETDERRTTLDSPYCRVHRGRLQETLRTRSDAVGVRRIQAKVRGDAASWCANIVDGIRHDAAGSTLEFDDGRTLRATSVVDCTGFESSLTSRQGTGTGPPPTFQVAYGIYGLVEEASLAPYDADAMLLFDYRDDHLPVKERDASPSFMYAMPLDLDEATGLRTVSRGVIRERHVATSMA
ncbi:unnamed protein product [Pelagomonas calceolata]|uniref:Lycopene beta-cyclase n=1 Tax=Pelagomonas calceolata TaxID=35677 RepID=A0A8J2SCI2_9STRA|nr:unnamed protein product [Pelagomonas calceolata]